MRHFAPNEFRKQYDRIDPGLFPVIDTFREIWGAPVMVSSAMGAIGRTTGRGFHNYIKHGSIKAIDLMPEGLSAGKYVKAYESAKQAGARGIGLYPQWEPQPGIHIDIGDRGRGPDHVATWSAFWIDGRQQYFSIRQAFKMDYADNA